ncbi:hypothetical protein CWI37_2248p0010 [Hamiltosporidium tvaerminnensis]|uniref:Uncharacterized protein n=1 Tax=Hamiltosporidium tvaerminnensis TaxID=1176355 RepID=A0A4Q9KU39_9MICR|nr:hypothetical protein CWI37_2248p0010 [Hamiltosporidium tvaerminnensis]
MDNSARDNKTCDVNVAMLSERLLSQPYSLCTTHQPPSNTPELVDKIKEISEKEIGEVSDSKVLDFINQIIGEYAKAHVPDLITEAAYVMQAAKVCYDEATRKENPRIARKKNIVSKISKLVLIKDLLRRL